MPDCTDAAGRPEAAARPAARPFPGHRELLRGQQQLPGRAAERPRRSGAPRHRPGPVAGHSPGTQTPAAMSMSRACARTRSGRPVQQHPRTPVADPGCQHHDPVHEVFPDGNPVLHHHQGGPGLVQQRPTASRTSRTPAGSRLAVGSSSRSSPGRIARIPASARRCFWPAGEGRTSDGPAAGRRLPVRRRRALPGRAARSPPAARTGFPPRRRRRRPAGRAPPGCPGPAASAGPAPLGAAAGRRRPSRPAASPASPGAQRVAVVLAQHPGQGMQQGGLAGARRGPAAAPVRPGGCPGPGRGPPGRGGPRAASPSRGPDAGGAAEPASRTSLDRRRQEKTGSEAALREAKALSTPVLARPRVASQDRAPAMTAPETVVKMKYASLSPGS